MIYLATPYSKYHRGQDEAFIAAANIAGRLIARGLDVFSPIVHGHPLAVMAAFRNSTRRSGSA